MNLESFRLGHVCQLAAASRHQDNIMAFCTKLTHAVHGLPLPSAPAPFKVQVQNLHNTVQRSRSATGLRWRTTLINKAISAQAIAAASPNLEPFCSDRLNESPTNVVPRVCPNTRVVACMPPAAPLRCLGAPASR